MLLRFLLWILQPWVEKLEERLLEVERHSLENARRSRKLNDELAEVSHRAQAITALDIPFHHDWGIVTIAARIRGRAVVHTFTIPPMEPARLRDLLDVLHHRYGAIDLADAPHGAQALEEFLGLNKKYRVVV